MDPQDCLVLIYAAMLGTRTRGLPLGASASLTTTLANTHTEQDGSHVYGAIGRNLSLRSCVPVELSPLSLRTINGQTNKHAESSTRLHTKSGAFHFSDSVCERHMQTRAVCAVLHVLFVDSSLLYSFSALPPLLITFSPVTFFQSSPKSLRLTHFFVVNFL